MSTLIVTLAPGNAGAATEYDYVQTFDGQSLSAQGRAAAALLPAIRKGEDVVAVVPARAMSWHRIKLPPGLGTSMRARHLDQPRLRAVLAGLMEEYLLDEPDQLHFAVFPGESAEASAWVAVCSRTWLHEAVQALEVLHRPLTRIVPEFAPVVDKCLPSTVHLISGMEPAQLVLSSPGGVIVLPLGAAAVAMAAQAGPLNVLAEPALAALAEQTFRQAVSLQTRAQRQLLASGSTWDLAQFDLSVSRRTRFFKAFARVRTGLWREPLWRPLRWGLVALLFTQVLGLHVWAWQEKSTLNEKRQTLRKLFSQTFPEVTVIVDAPLQMAREVAVLQQATGQSSGPGLVEALTSVAKGDSAFEPLQSIEWSAQELRLKGSLLTTEASRAMVNQMAQFGLRAQVQGNLLTLQREGSP